MNDGEVPVSCLNCDHSLTGDGREVMTRNRMAEANIILKVMTRASLEFVLEYEDYMWFHGQILFTGF